MDDRSPQEWSRAGDRRGWLPRFARHASQFWDFVDKRDIDKHFTSQLIIAFIIIGTMRVTAWGFEYAEKWMVLVQAGKTVSGVEVAAVLAAVLGPWGVMCSAMIAAVTGFYFRARV